MSAQAYPDLAMRDEYLDARLIRAAKIVWLRVSPTGPLDPAAEWLEDEIENLREVLQGRDQRSRHFGPLRLHALDLVGAVQAYLSSSARVEREADPEEARELERWVLASTGQA